MVNPETLVRIQKHLAPEFDSYWWGALHLRIWVANRQISIHDGRIAIGDGTGNVFVPRALIPALPIIRAWTNGAETLPVPDARFRTVIMGESVRVGVFQAAGSLIASRRERRIWFRLRTDIVIHPRLEHVLLVAHDYLEREADDDPT